MMRWTRRLERLLLAFGALTLGIYTIARIDGFIHSRAEVARFKSQQVFAQEAKNGAEGTGRQPDFSLWSANRIQGYQASLAAHFAPAVALLRISKIHLEVPVLEGTDDVILNRGVGHIAGTAKPGSDGNGNIGIAGHRDGFFRALKDVAMGDTIEIEAPNETRTYVIDQITIVDPSDVSVLSPRTRPSVTLVTCYPFYFVGSAPQRYIVQASLKNSDAKNPGTTDDAKF